jgi:uncharacterized membrane-anchored protein YitT (DUF2179 family)
MNTLKTSKYKEINWGQIFTLRYIIGNTIGIILIIFALKGFMIPNHFLDGGVLGVSLLIHELYHIDLSLLLIFGNLPLIYLGYKKISKTMGVHSMISILILALGLVLSNHFVIPIVTTDKILIAIFGGALLGAGIGIIMRSGAAIDGLEILLLLTKKKIGLSMSELIVIFNAAIFLAAAIVLGIDTAMFSIITYFTAAKMIDYVVNGIEQFTSLSIISGKSEEIKETIVNNYQKGITVYKGERGFMPGKIEISTPCDIIVTVVTRLELLKIKQDILKIDPHAFMFENNIKDANGGILKKVNNH